MLVTLLGSPCSGKTTTAAIAFASLKEQGVLAEFITEQARWYIASKRVQNKIQHWERVELTTEDQVKIMEEQLMHELTMKLASGPDVIVLSDSSALNALLYMEEETRRSQKVKDLTERALQNYDAIYYMKPLQYFPLGDPNRVHDKDFALNFDSRIPSLAEELKLKFAATIDTPQEREGLAYAILRSKFNL